MYRIVCVLKFNYVWQILFAFKQNYLKFWFFFNLTKKLLDLTLIKQFTQDFNCEFWGFLIYVMQLAIVLNWIGKNN